jgi:hypothetical protein
VFEGSYRLFSMENDVGEICYYCDEEIIDKTKGVSYEQKETIREDNSR